MPTSTYRALLVPCLLSVLALMPRDGKAAADLAATLASDALAVSAGGQQVFDAAVQNFGPDDSGAEIVEEFLAPPGAVVVDAWGYGWTCDPVTASKATCRFAGPLAAGHVAAPFHVRMLAPPQAGTVTAVASVPEPDSANGNNAIGLSTSVQPAPGAPDLRVEMPADVVVQAGDTFSLQLEVRNAGTGPATATVARSRIPAGFVVDGIDPGQDWNCNLASDLVTCLFNATLAAGSKRVAATLHLDSVSMNSPSVVSAYVAGTSDAAPVDNIDATTVFVLPPEVELSTWIDQAPAIVAVGQGFGYQIAVKNAGGGADASVLHLVGDLEGATLDGGGGLGGWACDIVGGTHFDCTHPGLGSGEVAVLSLAATAPAQAGAAQLSVAVQGGQGPDPLPGNDGDTAQTMVEAPDLALVQAGPVGNVAIGSPVDFVLTASNVATLANAATVSVTTTLPAQLGFVSVAGAGWTCGHASGLVSCTRPSLAAGGSAPAITVKAMAQALGIATHAAAVTAAGDANSANDAAQHTFRIVPPPNQPPQVPAGQSFAIAESAAAGTDVGAVAATDVDAADTLQFSMPDAATLPFAIDAVTGMISVDGPLDHESAPHFDGIDIEVSDGHATTVQTIDIEVTDVGGPDDVEHLPEIGSVLDFSVREDAAVGIAFGSVLASDDDPDDTLAFTLTADALLPFTIDGTSGQLRVDGALDFESTPGFPDVEVRVTDGKNVVTALLAITIVDVGGADDINVAPSIPGGQVFHVMENATAGSAIGELVATDADINDSLAFSMPAAAGLPFEIDAATGVLRVDGPLDFESTPLFTAVVVSVEDGMAQAFGTITIAIGDFGGGDDVNDAPTIPPGQNFQVDENAPVGTAVGMLHATDADAADTLAYAMPADAFLPFTIDAASGRIDVDGPIDFEATPVYAGVLVQVDDGWITTTQAITITVADLGGPDDAGDHNTPPQAGDDFLYAPPGQATTFAPGTLLSNDTDADGDPLAAMLVGSALPAGTLVTLQPDGGFTLQPPLGLLEGVVDFDYRIDDGRGGTDEAHVAVLVDGVPIFRDGFEDGD